MLRDTGQHADAIASYQVALSLKPQLAEAFRELSDIKKCKSPDELTHVLASLQQAVPEDQMHMQFGLGKAYEDLHMFDRAFDMFSAANKLRRATIQYSIEADRQLFAAIRDVVLQSRFAQLNIESEDMAPSAIFVVGMPRSGTSLVEQVP